MSESTKGFPYFKDVAKGAGIGALAGAAVGDEDNRLENAAIGAAVVGGGQANGAEITGAADVDALDRHRRSGEH